MEKRKTNKYKIKRCIISAFLVAVIMSFAVVVPISATVVGGNDFYGVRSTFPMSVGFEYDYGFSYSHSNDMVDPYVMTEDIGGAGNNYALDTLHSHDSFYFETHLGDTPILNYADISYSSPPPVFDEGSRIVFDDGSYIRRGHREYSFVPHSRIDPDGEFNTGDMLQKIRFSSPDVFYNPSVLKSTNNGGHPVGDRHIDSYCLPYFTIVPFNFQGQGHSYYYNYTYTATYDISYSDSTRDYDYTYTFSGNNYLEKEKNFLMVEPLDFREGKDTAVIENFEATLELSYGVPKYIYGVIDYSEPYGLWGFDENSFNSLSESDFRGRFYVGREPFTYGEISSVNSDKIMEVDEIRVDALGNVTCYFDQDSVCSIRDDNGNVDYRYIYVEIVDNQSYEPLDDFLNENANQDVRNSIGESPSWELADINSELFPYDYSEFIVNLPFYDTSHVSVENNSNKAWRNAYGFPNFDKYQDSYGQSVDIIPPPPSETNVNMIQWIVDAVGGFMEWEIFPHFSIGGILTIFVSFSLVLVLLRYLGGH